MSFSSQRIPNGSWEVVTTYNELQQIHRIQVVDNYLVYTVFDSSSPAFMGTMGGVVEIDGSAIHLNYEFNTFDTAKVGIVDASRFQWEGGNIKDPVTNMTLVPTMSPNQALDAAWTFTGRKRDGEVQRRTVGARKTMKILAGGNFQWIAFNTETAIFSGSGGGTYTAKDGKYVENIEFFSRDSSRVGASLNFDFELIEGEWHHQGLSSKGQPIYEVWSRLNLPKDEN